jgi:two-component system, chemotaxis family, sensor kinase Cph1
MQFIHPDSRGSVDARLRRMMVDEQPITGFTQKILKLDGGVLDVELSAVPFIHQGQQETQIIMRDVSERLAAQHELARTNAELEKFALVASHDLQEPLRTAANAALLLEDLHGPKLDGDARELIGFIVSAVLHMRQLIDGILVLSRIGGVAAKSAVADSETALTDALSNLKVAIDESGAHIERGALPMVKGDQGQVEQVFMNLISNAIKFRGSQPLRIRVAAERNGPEWQFSVADNGIGIEQQYAEKVFEMFERLHSRARYPGTGLGLAICRKIVEASGGRIWIESAEGQGARFRFTFAAAA